MASRIAFSATILDEAGVAVPNATIEVRSTASGTPLATLYSTPVTGGALSNPFDLTDLGLSSDGLCVFYVAPGQYTIEATFGGDTQTWVVDVSVSRDVQDSLTDTTGGRLLTTGSFGLGGTIVAATNDFNVDPGPNRFYRTGNLEDATGAPPGASFRRANGVMMRGFDGEETATILINANVAASDQIEGWLGAKYEGAADMFWARLFHDQNVLGTVSQIDGVPTGAIIESGSNANGEYTRWADGTQICTNGNASITTNPAAFIGTVTDIDSSKMRIGRWF